ncbi:MAG: hypothetical protein ABMB14_27630 [Myxococcota bacterium]
MNRVPQVTLYFWVIKILATTVGETAADFLSETLGLGLERTTAVMSVVLLVALVGQFWRRRYVPAAYWLVVVLLSIVGTLVTDGLVDDLGVPLEVTTGAFSIALLCTFAVWYRRERTLSIHSIDTAPREAFYWLAILFTFALGTAAGDWVAEGLGVGFWQSAVLFATLMAAVTGAWRFLRLPPVPAFWAVYILTRPLGASIGDLLSQAPEDGGLGLGTVVTSGVFLAVIAAVVVFLTVTGKDRILPTESP